MAYKETFPYVPDRSDPDSNVAAREFDISALVHEGTSGNAHTVHIGCVSLHFSYCTLVGITLREDNPYRYGVYRRENEWGSTTAKHMKLLGLQHADVRTAHELQELVRGALFQDVVHVPLMKGD